MHIILCTTYNTIQILRNKVGMTNFTTLYLTNTYTEKQGGSRNTRLRVSEYSFLRLACTRLFSYTLRILNGHSSNHLDYSEGLILWSTIPLQHDVLKQVDTARRLYSMKSKHNVLRPRKMISTYLHTLKYNSFII